ncbi:hypothetical protein VTN02DRAFT_5706 [Thermoascus thermophilus]
MQKRPTYLHTYTYSPPRRGRDDRCQDRVESLPIIANQCGRDRGDKLPTGAAEGDGWMEPRKSTTFVHGCPCGFPHLETDTGTLTRATVGEEGGE